MQRVRDRILVGAFNVCEYRVVTAIVDVSQSAQHVGLSNDRGGPHICEHVIHVCVRQEITTRACSCVKVPSVRSHWPPLLADGNCFCTTMVIVCCWGVGLVDLFCCRFGLLLK